MSVEMACGNCQGRFVAATAGTVACPHCGTHLLVAARDVNAPTDVETQPAEAGQEIIQPFADIEEPQDSGKLFAGYAGLVDDEGTGAGELATGESGPAIDVEALGASDSDGDEATVTLPPDSLPQSEFEATIPDFSAIDVGEPAAGEASFDFGEEPPTLAYPKKNEPTADASDGEQAFSSAEDESPQAIPDFGEPAGDDEPQDDVEAVLAAAGTEAVEEDERPDPVDEAQPAVEAGNERTPQSTAAGAEPVVSRSSFLLLASYASAVTLVCLWLLAQVLSGGGGDLENLKDPAETRGTGKKKRVEIVAVAQQLPRGHVLELGESRRFGNIIVAPQKVTRGPLEFEHFSQEDGAAKPPTAPVLKLWLRFENRSSDQEIAPLDSILLYENRIHNKKNFDEVRGNTFVCRAEEKSAARPRVAYVYPLNMNDNWNLRGQQLPTLAPGESCVAFVPAGPAGIDELAGDLVWRVHIRKGYSPSNRGVTTLIEVNFHSDTIQNETTAAANETTAAR